MLATESENTPNISAEQPTDKVVCRDCHTRHEMIGCSASMQTVFEIIETVAAVPSAVLIAGESGTGKELVARAIHKSSARARQPFVSINCGAIPETLLESELFGYVKGAFTGAAANRKGLFEAADNGTIFLDEIGELPLSMQVKLLRVPQEQRVRPVGAHEEVRFDTRVIAATNRDLSQMTKDNTFREDLYYRIAVIPIDLPPLRERREDICHLARHFVHKFAARINKDLRLGDAALRVLENYPFPGNVRELEHIIERAAAFEKTAEIQPERLPDYVTNYDWMRVNADLDLPIEGIALTQHLELLEQRYLLAALRRTQGNQTEAADLLQISVRTLRHLLDKHNLRNLSAELRPRKVKERCVNCERYK